VSHLYVVQIGTTVKVGISTGPNARFVDYRRDARRYGLTFDVLWISPAHLKAEENERAVLTRFRRWPQRDEYLRNVDANAVVTFAQALAFTPVEARPAGVDRWISRDEGAAILGTTVQTLERHIRNDDIRRRKNPITGRVTVSSVDCEHIALRRGQVAPA
jgi:hypothetical protein